MQWFFIALIGPFLYAITNHIDKVLLEKYFKAGGIGTLLLFSSLMSVFALPLLFLADHTVFDVSGMSLLILLIVAFLDILVLVFYFIALKNDEASIVIVFYQLMPVFAYGFGYLILGETLTRTQLLAMVLIILGTFLIAFEVNEENKYKFRHKTIIPMMAASFFWALQGVIFKLVALEDNVFRSLFWKYAALALIGLLIFTFMPYYRHHFIKAIRDNSKAILSLNILNEVLYMIGNFAFASAYLLAPIALVLMTQSFQPVFVLIIGVFLTIFFPEINSEKIHIKHLLPKIIAVFITGIGTYLLFI